MTPAQTARDQSQSCIQPDIPDPLRRFAATMSAIETSDSLSYSWNAAACDKIDQSSVDRSTSYESCCTNGIAQWCDSYFGDRQRRAWTIRLTFDQIDELVLYTKA